MALFGTGALPELSRHRISLRLIEAAPGSLLRASIPSARLREQPWLVTLEVDPGICPQQLSELGNVRIVPDDEAAWSMSVSDRDSMLRHEAGMWGQARITHPKGLISCCFSPRTEPFME